MISDVGFLIYKKPVFLRFSIITILAALNLLSCKTHDEVNIHRGFYYWKSRFETDSTELKALQDLKAEKLYIKFFDVAWNELRKLPEPVAKIDFISTIPHQLEVVPVVFITNETLQQANANDIENLGLNIPKLIGSILENSKIRAPKEIQLDCDWTASTKDKYFLLLKQLRKSNLFHNKTLSVTIRLHQVKYVNETGTPPADRGLLMCYNMGNLRKPETRNSIIETATLQQYIGNMNAYPLPLNIALPIFDWWVWFQQNEYKGLIHGDALQLPIDESKKWRCRKDTTINGYTFKAGDWLRYENSPVETNIQVVSSLKQHLNSKDLTIILYHLDTKTITHYETSDLESFYTGFDH